MGVGEGAMHRMNGCHYVLNVPRGEAVRFHDFISQSQVLDVGKRKSFGICYFSSSEIDVCK